MARALRVPRLSCRLLDLYTPSRGEDRFLIGLDLSILFGNQVCPEQQTDTERGQSDEPELAAVA